MAVNGTIKIESHKLRSFTSFQCWFSDIGPTSVRGQVYDIVRDHIHIWAFRVLNSEGAYRDISVN